MEGKTRKAEQSEATRAELIRVARELFSERGYAAVGTEEIVSAARVTRGALYHHFVDKKDLFRAAYEQIEEELVGSIGSQLGAAQDPVAALAAGIRAFLDFCTDPTRTRIPLVDAPSVLGWAQWREIDQRYALGLTTAALSAGMDSGDLRRQPVGPLAHLLLAALGEAGLLIAAAEDPRAVRPDVESALLALLDGLRAKPV